MWNLFVWVDDPITPVIDGKLIGLVTVSVMLFIVSTIIQYLTNEKLTRMEAAQKENTESERALTNTLKDFSNQFRDFKNEKHEQWAQIVETGQLTKENNLRLHDINETLDGIAQQQTQIASAQLNTTQATQKVIENLIEALTETRD